MSLKFKPLGFPSLRCLTAPIYDSCDLLGPQPAAISDRRLHTSGPVSSMDRVHDIGLEPDSVILEPILLPLLMLATVVLIVTSQHGEDNARHYTLGGVI